MCICFCLHVCVCVLIINTLSLGIVEEFSKAQARIDQLPEGEMKTFADYQAEAFASCKSIAKLAQEIINKSNNNPKEIMTSSREMTVQYGKLVDSTQGALATIDSDEVCTCMYMYVHIQYCTHCTCTHYTCIIRLFDKLLWHTTGLKSFLFGTA